MSWKIQDRRASSLRRELFCPRCDRCMHTEEDVRSRDSVGTCRACADGISPEARSDEARISIDPV